MADEQVTELAVAIDTAEHLIFDGLQAYQGTIQHEPDHDQRKTELDAVIAKVKSCLESLAAAGPIALLLVAAAQAAFEAASGIYTEIQCGSYAFMDADYGRIHTKTGIDWIRQNGKMRCFCSPA